MMSTDSACDPDDTRSGCSPHDDDAQLNILSEMWTNSSPEDSRDSSSVDFGLRDWLPSSGQPYNPAPKPGFSLNSYCHQSEHVRLSAMPNKMYCVSLNARSSNMTPRSPASDFVVKTAFVAF